MIIGEKKGSIPSFESFRRNTPKSGKLLGEEPICKLRKEKDNKEDSRNKKFIWKRMFLGVDKMETRGIEYEQTKYKRKGEGWLVRSENKQ